MENARAKRNSKLASRGVRSQAVGSCISGDGVVGRRQCRRATWPGRDCSRCAQGRSSSQHRCPAHRQHQGGPALLESLVSQLSRVAPAVRGNQVHPGSGRNDQAGPDCPTGPPVPADPSCPSKANQLVVRRASFQAAQPWPRFRHSCPVRRRPGSRDFHPARVSQADPRGLGGYWRARSWERSQAAPGIPSDRVDPGKRERSLGGVLSRCTLQFTGSPETPVGPAGPAGQSSHPDSRRFMGYKGQRVGR